MADLITVAAVAGRRIDAPDTDEPRFPEAAVSRVASEVTTFFANRGIRTVVASAACGADLVALEAAAKLGIRTIIVLPFDRVRFRNTSVVDRGASWGPRYDAALARAEQHGAVIVLDASDGDDDDDAYARATARIIDEARARANADSSSAVAVAIWDNRPRSSTDATRDFVEQARAAGMSTVSIDTAHP